MKAIPKPSITEVFHHYDAVVMGADRGSWQKATCALLDHDDRSPSASVNESECRWHCWTCDKGGDAVDLVKENEGLARTVDAIRLTEELFGAGDGGGGEERGSSSLVPRAKGHRAGRRNWSPPWMSL